MPPGSPRTSSCSRPTPVGSPVTGAPRRCFAPTEGGEAVGLPDDERFVSLIHIGNPAQEQRPPERDPATDFVTFLD